jgi:galactose-1-phosphate uridylyltransferase
MHSADFSNIQKEEVTDLARILKETLMRMKLALKNPSYNFIIHTAPLDSSERADYHWHIEVMPRMGRTAGFEWGTGFYLNPTPPEIAAWALREVSLNEKTINRREVRNGCKSRYQWFWKDRSSCGEGHPRKEEQRS